MMDPSPPVRRDSSDLRFWMRLAIASIAIAMVAVGVAIWALTLTALEPPVVAPEPPAEVEPLPLPEPRLVLEPGAFADLPGWAEDPLGEALEAYRRGCEGLGKLPADRSMEPAELGLVAADWQRLCELAPGRGASAGAMRAFFEGNFAVWRVGDGEDFEGLMTGYYEPTLDAARSRRPGFETPLYRRPPELIAVELGRFRENWKGERTAGVVVDGTLVPFADREAITKGALEGRGLEIAWARDPVDAFFLQIQGSGRLRLVEGGEMRVGFEAQNGHVYTAIGRTLIDRGELTRESVSMQSIRRWLDTHPEQAAELLAENKSFVFFRELDGEGPLGSLGVALVPQRSVAVDRALLPLGAPLYLHTGVPGVAENDPDTTIARLVVALDTGGAIRGPLRADLFWGPGEEAASRAGRMKHPGRLWLLTPRRNPA